MAQQPYQVINLFDWTGGVRDRRHNPLAFPSNAVTAGENVDLADGGLKTRLGMSVTHSNSSKPRGAIRFLKQLRFPTNETTYLVAQASERHETVWEPKASGPELEGHSAVWDPENGRMLVFGGRSSTQECSNDLWAYDPDANTWSTATASGTRPSARYGHTAVMDAANGSMYVFGGRDAGGALNDCYTFDISTDTWSQVTMSGTIPSVRYRHAAVLIPGSPPRMLICGGRLLSTSVLPVTTYFLLDLSTYAWTQVDGAVDGGLFLHSRCGHGLCYDGANYVYLTGGDYLEAYYSDCWRLDLATQTWHQLADLPATLETGLSYQQSLYCSGYITLIGGRGAMLYDYNTAYQVYACSADTWLTVAPDGDLGTRHRHVAVSTDDQKVIIHGGIAQDTPEEIIRSDTWCANDLCSEAAGTGYGGSSGLYASSDHLPATSIAFEEVYPLSENAGVVSIETLGDRTIITEGVEEVPLVFLPGTLSTDPAESWASPMRVLLTYDGQNFHDVSDRVLDNDLDSVAHIGGITTRGAILICCDVPTVYGFYLQFKKPNTATGATSEFSDETRLNATARVNRENIGYGIARWLQDSAGATGHFEGPARALSGVAVDLGGSPNRVKIPCVGHGLVADNQATIRNTAGYDNDYLLPDQTGGDADHFIIEHAYIGETFSGASEVRQWFTVGQPEGWTANLPLIETGAEVEFADATLTVRDIAEGGADYDTVTLSAEHETASVSGIYGVTANDANVVTVSAATDVPDVLFTTVPANRAWLQGRSIRQVIKGSDLAANSAYVRIKIQSGDTLADYNNGIHVIAASIVERSSGANGADAPTALTFNNGSLSVDVPRAHPAWTAGKTYTPGYKVTHAAVVYQCLIQHSSGVFAIDLASGKWLETGDPLGHAWSDFVQFPIDNTKDYLVIFDLAAGSGFPSTTLLKGSAGSAGGAGSGAPPANWSSLAYANKPYGDSHVFYGLQGKQTATLQTVSGIMTTTYGILGVTEIDGISAELGAVSTLHVATTNADSRIDTTSVDAFKSVAVEETKPGASKAYYALSVDDKQTFLIHNGSALRAIAKLDAGAWQYIDGSDVWHDAGSAEPFAALRAAFAIAENQMTGSQMAARTQDDWADIVGYPTLDFAVGLQADGSNVPTVTKFILKVYDSGGAEVAGWVAGNWAQGAGWTDNTVDGVPFGKNGTILYNGSGGFTADYGVIAGIPGFWYRAMMRGTAAGTSLTKVRFRAPCQPLQNIGDGQPDTPLGFVFYDTSDGKILDYTVEMSDSTYTALSSAPLPMEAEDFIYVGYLTPFNEIEIIPYADNNQNVSVLTVKYWNGLTWQALSIADGTTGAGKTFRKRGKIKWTLPTDWKENFPLEGLSLGYWLQFSVSASLSTTTMLSECRIYPVPHALVKHKGAAVFQNRLALFDRPDAHGQVDISKETLECCFSGDDTYSYNLGNQITCGISAWNTLLLGGVDSWSQLGGLSPQGMEFHAVEAARHVPVSSRAIVKAPLGIGDDGDRYGLFFINHYGAFCQSGLATDSTYGTSRALTISDTVSWWNSSSSPRLDKDYLHVACGEFWPARNWVVWSVPMIVSGEGPQPTNNRLIVFDLSLRTWLPPLTMSLASLTTACHYNPSAPGKIGSVGFYAGDYQGRILRLFGPDDVDDAGEPINAWVETGWLHFGSPEYRKILRLLSIYGKSRSGPIAVAVYADGEDSPRLTLSFDDLAGLGARPFALEQESNNIQGRFYKFRISFSGPADIYGLQLGLAVVREWGA